VARLCNRRSEPAEVFGGHEDGGQRLAERSIAQVLCHQDGSAIECRVLMVIELSVSWVVNVANIDEGRAPRAQPCDGMFILWSHLHVAPLDARFCVVVAQERDADGVVDVP
jgi:hypothetical protein